MDKRYDDLHKANGTQEANWEHTVIEKIALAAITEQTRARRWSVFFKSLAFCYLTIVLGITLYPVLKKDMNIDSKEHTAVIDVTGPIAEDKEANATSIIESLRNAVKDKQTKGIILHSNSPGGSPVQSAYVYEEIRTIKKQHPDLPIYAVVSDICASGCYYIASATDKIFVNPSSLIGSIGVLMDGFGFVDVMQKLGVERRLLTAGAHKAMLDPFSPPKTDETKYMQGLLDQVHQQFISAVKAGRGDRLIESPDMFSGLIWTGEAGVKIGIADAFGTEDFVAKDIIGAENRVDFTKQSRFLDKIAGKLGASFGQAVGTLLQSPNLR